jgi:hypothetical protein
MELASTIRKPKRIHLLLLGIMTPTIDETDIMEIVVDEEIEAMYTLNQPVIEAINFLMPLLLLFLNSCNIIIIFMVSYSDININE